MGNSWKVILAFAGVFLAGGICGGLVARRMDKSFHPGNRRVLNQTFWPQVMLRMEERLELTPEQKPKILLIVRHAQSEVQGLRREHFGKIARVMDQMHTEISSLLTPEQQLKLEEMRKKFRERIERERAEARGGGRPGN